MVDAEFLRHKCHKEADALLVAQLRGLDHRRDGLMERAGLRPARLRWTQKNTVVVLRAASRNSALNSVKD